MKQYMQSHVEDIFPFYPDWPNCVGKYSKMADFIVSVCKIFVQIHFFLNVFDV